MLNTRYVALIALFTLCGCPMKNSDPEPDSGAADAGGAEPSAGIGGRRTVGAPDGSAAGAGGTLAGESPKLPAPDGGTPNLNGKPIGIGCATSSECASGFCVDGVCCNTTCDDQCFSCNQATQVGYCTAQLFNDDLNAAVPCTGSHTCGFALAALNIAACRLRDQQACKGNSDCATLNCQTFYVDHDGDGYGETGKTLQLCEDAGAAAPGGYVTEGGDCCDGDSNAFPGQTSYFKTANACGSWDYSCDGTIEGATGASTMSSVPASECGTTVHGSCTSCTQTVVCH